MMFDTKARALAGGLVVALAAASLAQAQNPRTPPPGQAPAPVPTASPGDVLTVGDAVIDWIEKSDVAALREGVILKMELQVGHEVREGGTIGQLHDEIAQLKVRRAELASKNVAAIEKGKAQKELASATLAISYRLRQRGKTFISEEEVLKNEAEVKVADALVKEAQENKALSESELELAKRELEEHIIKAPFTGLITERMKNDGESVRANEPVVRLVRRDKLRVAVWVPIEYAIRLRVGTPVEVTPNIPGAVLPIEQKRFKGKITFVDPEAEPTKSEVRVYAEVENNAEHELMPGLKADMVIYVNGGMPGAAPPATVGQRTAPPLPR